MSAELIEQINQLQTQLNVQLASKYEKHLDNQLTAKQVFVLELIRAGLTTSTEIAANMNVSTSAVSQLLNKLEEHHFIYRSINRTNRRKNEIQLAEKSIRYFEQMTQLEKEINEKLYGQLPEQDLQALSNILGKLHKIIGDE